jgi:KDO2-lipid IV(A) lauroyltransferase
MLWSVGVFGPALAMFYARLLDLAVPRLRRTALRNLELAFPDRPPADRAHIADGVFRSIGRIIYAFARLPSINASNVHRWIRYEGLDNYLEAKRQGRGILVATGHLGNWELSAFSHAIMTEPMNVVVRPLDNARLDAFVEARRQLTGNKIIGKSDAPRAILKALRANEAVGILIDQNTSPREGVFIDFFGVPACTGTAFVRFAARTGAVVIPGFALWSEAEHLYVLRFYPPVPITGDVVPDTQRLHSALEAIIREHPDQWLWIHRRWKNRPSAAPPVYGE